MIAYALFAPLPAAPKLPAAPAHAKSAAIAPGTIANPFRSVGPAELVPAAIEEGPDLAETTLDLTLHGTWVDDMGGAAIVKTPDGRQSRFAPGDEIWDGVVLDRIYRDQVVIVSRGVRESLRLVNREAVRVSTPPAAAPAKPLSRDRNASSQGLGLGEAVRVIPRTTADGIKLTLEPGADKARFAAMGLRSGDILTAVDNRRLGSDLMAEIQRLRGLSGRSVISVAVERDGITLPLELDLSANGNAGPDDD